MRYTRVLPAVVAAVWFAATASAQQIPTPASVLGFEPGTDRKLVEWPTLVEYYRQLGATSDRVEYRELGPTTLGAPFVTLVISSPANLAKLETYRRMNAKLADPRTIESRAERERLLRDGKTIVLITSSIHSTEVGGHLSPTIIADRLAQDSSPDVLDILDNTILLLVPSLNPDGVSIVSRWYNQTLGTPYEGTSPPTLYHHYVGHDNNRDWYAFTQVETQYTIDSLHNQWHPQIVHDIHQQGATGSRYFLPPYLDPVEPNVDPLIVQGFTSLGTHMAWELAGQGKKGIVVSATYDAWTPARSYQHHHAGVRILSETASARLASPIDIPLQSLRGRRGFDAQQASWNFPEPWGGGVWTLANIVDYQSSGALSLLRHAASHRDVWLSNFLKIGERAVRGWDTWPYAIVIPEQGQNEIGLKTMLGILERGQVAIQRARSSFVADGQTYPSGTYVIVLRQPYGSFAKALLERQQYPDLRLYPGGPPRAPYDVTAHTLPLLMGVSVAAVRDSIAIALSAPAAAPEPRYWFEGLSDEGTTASRIGLYKSYSASMDEGWTRWIFDEWRIPYVSLVDGTIRAGNLRRDFDVVIIPDMSASAIVRGRAPSTAPARYAGGLGTSGVDALRRFVEEGGRLITFNSATRFAIETFDLPVENVLAQLDNQDFYAPGTLFRMQLDPRHPVTRGMPTETVAWFQQGPAFSVRDSSAVRVIGRYPDDAEQVLLSGWVLHPERLAGRAALLEARVGEGSVILFGFKPQYRGQSIATYPLLFNAIAQ